MKELLANLPDVTTFAANVVVFLTAIGAAVAGAMHMVKKIKESWLETIDTKKGPGDSAKIAGGLIVESTTMMMWTESNKDVVDMIREAITMGRELRNEVMEVRHKMDRLTDAMRERK